MTAPRSLSLLLAACALLGACGRGDESAWTGKLDADPLQARAKHLLRSRSCAGLVPMEFGRTFPVPADRKGSFVVLYYPQSPGPGRGALMTPMFQGTFSMASPGADGCTALGIKTPVALGSPPAPMSMEEATRLELRLFETLAMAASLYMKGAGAGESKPVLGEFAGTFLKLAEPPLLPHYYRLNPDFWEWLRREGGLSIPKA